MATEPSNQTPPVPGPPPAPAPGAPRDEWHAWRHQQRHYMRAQWMHGDWYGPWGGWFGLRGWFWGIGLVLIGLYYLLTNLGLLPWLRGDVVWPVLLILLGIGLLVRRGRGWWP